MRRHVSSLFLLFLVICSKFVGTQGISPITGSTPCISPLRQSSEQNCFAGKAGNVCKWQSNGCVYNTATSLGYQKFPLEAATATLFTAVWSAFQPDFWITYVLYLQAERFAAVTDVNLNDPNGLLSAVEKMIVNLEILLNEDEYFVILDGIRVGTIAGRDVIFSALEFIRSFIFVFNKGQFPPAYQQFQTVMYKIITFVENAVAIFVNEGFEVLVEMGQIAMDFAQIVLDPAHALTYLQDILVQIEKIVSSALQAFKTFILSIPGLDQMCKWINELIGFINTIIGGLINDVIIPIINFVLGVVHTLEKFFQDAFSAVEHGLQDAIHFVESFFQNVIGAVESVIHTVIGGIEGIFHDIVGAYNGFVGFVNNLWNNIINPIRDVINAIDYFFGRRRLLGIDDYLSQDGDLTPLDVTDAFIHEALQYGSRNDLIKLTAVAKKLVDHLDPDGNKRPIASESVEVKMRKLLQVPTINADTSNGANFGSSAAPTANIPPPSPAIDNGESPMQNLLVPFHIPSIQCSLLAPTPMIPIEPTPCVYDSDCVSSTSYCKLDSNQECIDPTWLYGAQSGGFNLNDLWEKPCPCTALSPQSSFCNVAAGFCQAGISPFGDPLATCPANGINAFVDSTPFFNAMCFIVPAYKCASGIFSDGFPRTDAQVLSCVQDLVNAQQLSGPHLCRDFCSPSVFNIDNHLVQITLPASQQTICACAIGWSVGGNQPLPGVANAVIAQTGMVGGRRMVLQNDSFSSLPVVPVQTSYYDDDWFLDQGGASASPWMHGLTLFGSYSPNVTLMSTTCFNNTQCEHAAAICDTSTGVTACASCPMRNFYGDSGHSCMAAKCSCDPVPSNPLAVNFSRIVWKGTSDCAMIGQAYGKLNTLSALQYVALRNCAHKHFVGALVGKALGMPTLSPRIMYDSSEQLRAAGHIGVGLLIGSLLTNFDDNKMFEAFNVLRIDPGMAIPAAKIAQASVQKIYDLVPRTRSIAHKVGRIWIRTAIAYQVMPSNREILQTTRIIKNATVYFVSSPLYKAGVNKMRTVYEEVQTFRTDIETRIEANGGMRRLRSGSGLVGLNCPILATAITDIVIAGNTMANDMKNNVPRAVCRFLHPGGDWHTCQPPSWQLPLLNPPPPPSPPHTLIIAAPPPPTTTQTVTGGNFRQNTVSKYVFIAIQKLTGYDIRKLVIDKLSYAFDNAPALTVAQKQTASVIKKIQCQFESSVQCRTQSHDLLYNTFYLAFEILLVYTVMKILKMGSLVPVVSSFLLLGFVPRVLNMTYNLQFACSISYAPTIPVCFVSEIQDLVYRVLPRHLPWPSPLVNNHGRVTTLEPIITGKPLQFTYLTVKDVQNCAAYGFGDGVTEVIYWVDYWIPGWQKYFSTATVDTFLGFSPVQQFNYYANKPIHTNIYRQCAILYAFNVIPVVLAFGVLVFFTIALFHLLILFTRYILMFLRYIYEALAEAYIETRDAPDDE